MNYINLFKESVVRHPDSTALVDNNGKRSITYAGLDILSSRVAGKLKACGYREGDFIIINMGRQLEYIASYLGILKAGCIVVPVVPDYPEERISFIRDDCGSRLTITADFLSDIEEFEPYGNPVDGGKPAILAYTSGSTGNPKGILMSTADLARSAMRHAPLYNGVNPVVYGSAALFSFLIHIVEYLTTFHVGGTVHIIGDDVRKSATALADYYQRNGITIGVITPQMLRLYKNTAPTLQMVFTGSERVSRIAPDGYRIINGYGMSETQAFVTTFNIDHAYDNTPVGKSMEGIEVTIRDDDGNVLPDGCEGEICAYGEFDTIYFKDPERTRQFLCYTEDGKRLIHTGDVGYVNENGDIVYTNRKDWMVKINGQRVETLEIETILMDFPQVDNAAVKAFVDADSQNYLVAFYTEKEPVEETELRKALLRKLPEYMVPRFFVRMDELPKNTNGKLNRKALMPPAADQYKAAYVAPADSVEKTVCEAFEQILHCGTVGTSDDFLNLGGDSIKVLKLIDKIGLPGITPEKVFEARTPKRIAALYSTGQTEHLISHSKETPEICPLSDSQLGVYLDSIGQPESTKYNIPVLCTLPDDVDIERFKAAVSAIAGKHDILGVTIKDERGVPSMVYRKRVFEIQDIDVDDINRDCHKLIRPFNLEEGPLYRFMLLHSSRGYAFFFDIHHIIFDGSSVSTFVSQISQVYAGDTCPDESLSLFDVAMAGNIIKQSEAYHTAQEYFRNKLDGIDCDSTPVSDRIETDVPDGGGYIKLTPDSLNVTEVTDFTKSLEITENALFQGAFAYTLAKFNNASDSYFCTVSSGKQDTRLVNSFGMFVKTLPLYFRIDESQSVQEFLVNAHKDFRQTLGNECIDFSELAAGYGIGMNVSFAYQGELFSEMPLGKGNIQVEVVDVPDVLSDINFMVFKSGGSYTIRVEFRKSLFTEELMMSLTRMYINVIKSMLTATTLADVELADSDAREQIASFNRTDVPYDTDRTIVELFREQAAKTPDNPCVVYQDVRMTYRQVDEMTDRLARHLISHYGTGRESIVGILIPRCEYMVICALGVLKAGGAYMPLDPSYPEERLNLMMQDSGAALLITTPELDGIIDESLACRRMMTAEIPSLPQGDAVLPQPATDDKFVLLYTSGSTGVPKGVIFHHSNTMVTAAWERRFYDLGPGCNVTAYASFGFDANVFDTYATITSGATLHIISDDIRLDLPALRDYFNDNGITHTTMTTQVGRQFAEMGGVRTLRYLNVAGEKLTPLTPPAGFNMFNLYGPTEGSVLASGFLIDKLYKDIPIGKAIDNVKLYVADSKGRLLPAGAAGELWISGAHVTAGYLNRPEKTAEAYGSNPFCNDPGYERVYRTGDIVRFLNNGDIQFIGRRDGQVKVRGFRIELTEVEEVIRRFNGIKDATVAAFDAPSGGKFIAAYVVSDQPVDIDALNAFIRDEKPPYMVPSVTMQIDKIPLNQNQKVNKKALPRPERKAENIVAPENQTQQKIFDIACQVLGHKEFGVESNLFDSGLTSIGMLKMNVMLGEEFNTSIKIDDLRRNDTIRKLEAFLASSDKVQTYDILADYPVTETQLGIFIECSANPDSVTYNIPVLVTLSDKIDTDRLVSAVRQALDAHPYTKTTLFADANGDIRTRRNDSADPVVECVSVSALPSPEELVRPFTLLESPLYRACVFKTKNGNYLFLDSHHIISDGTSEAILISDIDKAYSGQAPAIEKFTGFEYALDEEKARSSEAYTRAREYYDSVFRGCEPECLPPKSPESETVGAASVYRKCPVPADDVIRFCQDNKITVNAFLNTAFGLTLCRFGNLDDAVYTTVYNGRNDSRIASSFTMLVKTLPVMVHNSDGKTLELIRATQEQLMSNMSNDIYSFAEISKAYGIKSDIIFVYQGDNFNFDTLCGEKATFRSLLPPVAKATLSITVNLIDGRFDIAADYRKDIYSAPLIESLIDAMGLVVRCLISKESLKDVSLLSEESAMRLTAINDTKRPYQEIAVNKLFEKEVAAHPERKAVTANGRSLTYDELNRLANRLAHTLKDYGIKRDSVVAMILDRSVELSVCEIGILKSGGAFLGILPSYPDDRIEYCLRDAGTPVVITTETIKSLRPELLSDDKPYKTLTIEEALSVSNEDNLNLDIPADSLAYCIYTSGSTGNPKGVMIEHRNLACLVQPADFAYSKYFGGDDPNVSLALSSISFDMSVFDHLTHLLCGNTVCIATDQEIHNPVSLATLMIDNRVDTLTLTPSILSNYIGVPEFRKAIEGVRNLVSGAEAFPATLFNELRGIAPQMNILNGYGPSECTCTCCAKLLKSAGNITIGGPSANTAFYVVDKYGNILPPFACGELIICGDLVGRGYINLPEKTAASFYTLNGLPAYHSGDTVRFNKDGEIEFFGRMDNQVKLRGFRVELDEIERCIVSFSGIKQSKVIVRNNGSEDYLAAFFTADRQIDPAELTQHLKSRLTYYMVPDVMAQLESIPLTPSGKVDKKALPDIKRESRKTGRKAPKKSVEEQLCDLFKSILSLDSFYADDNFFEMGGTSLSASKVIMQLMSKGIKVEYQDIFDNPTPEMLAEYIESLNRSKEDSAQNKSNANGDSEINELLKYNTLEFAPEVTRQPIGDVLLTGATGFLGIHILKELLERNEGKIICLVRKGDMPTPEERLQNMLMYYFDYPYEEAFKDHIKVLDTDITNDDLPSALSEVRFDTIINCAAVVKHYSSDNTIEHVNVHGVENLIRVAKETGARMIQISTVSIPGVHTQETYLRQVKMHENELFVIDDMDNKYGISKYHAELRMLDAIRQGMRGKIIRVGNLMGRHSDGEFQINFNTNAFLNALRGFTTIGKCPISHSTDPMSFSPIDMTARAIVLLAGTNDKFTAFHADSRFGFDEMQLIEASNRCGLKITPVPDEEYYADYYRMLGDAKVNGRLQGLVTNDRPDLHVVDTDNMFTANVLYRLGFSWPLVDSAYLERAISSLITLDYFMPDE